MLLKFWQNQRGQDTVEYALIMAFIASAAVAVSPSIATVTAHFSRSMSVLETALSVTAAR